MPDEADALQPLLSAIHQVVEADLAVILALEDSNTLRVLAASGRLAGPVLPGLRIDLRRRPALAAAIQGDTACLVHGHPGEEVHEAHEPDTYSEVLDLPDSHTCLAAPLRAEGQLVGVLTLDAVACGAYSPDQVRAIDAFAGLAARVLLEQQRADRLAREVDALAAATAGLAQTGPAGAALVGQSQAWRDLLARVRLVAPTPATVLITGETGSGKEQVARAIHQWSPRAGGPFIALNCSALVPDLALSELFGHEKGAFTGADRRRAGRFELAEGGTLFLDEVAELPPTAQAQLLRVLQERTFERVGGAGELITADVRLITATHKDLAAEVAAGRFREDLYYRLNTFPLHVPPLRERMEDLPVLADHFVRRLRDELDMPRLALSSAGLRRLAEHTWPGNVRELRNALERAAILAGGRTIRPEHLDLPSARPSPASHGNTEFALPAELRRLDRALAAEILAALHEAGGKIAGPGGAAERLGVKPTTLHSMMKRLKLK